MREFFAEKLNLPIDYFNAVRNVKLGSGVDTAAATSMAHCLGEVVGCALREVGPCPAELELVPEVVQAERRMHRRKPLLMLATLVAVCGFVASGFYYLRAADIAESNYDKLVDKADQLQDFDEKIEAQRNTLTEASSRMKPYSEAIFQRAIWVGLLQDLNGRMEQETLWITAFQPMIMGPEKKWTRVFSDGNTVGFSGSSQPGGDEMVIYSSAA